MRVARFSNAWYEAARQVLDVERITPPGGIVFVQATCGDATVKAFVVSGRVEATATTPEGMAVLLECYVRAMLERKKWAVELLSDTDYGTQAERAGRN